ncbi:MAG TPA: glycerol-3-phosphate transporter permease, partial [Burkholderiaceae bacterium]|nr:glycerol-3-phosphate transporter permease [Burkholderiaceae bacterium]
MVEQRSPFHHRWLAYALVAPQIAITLVFFLWPAAQALRQSVMIEDAFGANTQFVGLEQFSALFSDAIYFASFTRTIAFAMIVAVLGLGVALVLAVFADRVTRGMRVVYRAWLIWPYAVA